GDPRRRPAHRIARVALASQTDILARGLPMRVATRVEGLPHPGRELRRRSLDVARACRMDTGALAKNGPAPTNMRRKRWHWRIAPPAPLSGQTPGRRSTTSATPTITVTPTLGPICASR